MQIPTKYNPKNVEEKVYKQWLDEELFNAEVNPQKDHFCIVIPPPNITGILHMGHALNNTIQDTLIRFKRMYGFESLWMPGTDHAGIATQNVVEKQLAKENLKKEDIGRDKFLERLWAWRQEYGSTILQQLKKLGASCDWRRTRFTMDDDYSEAVKEVFIRLYEKGLIYRGNYIINWCPRCLTALSDEESPHKEIDGWLYYIRYPVLSAKNKKENYIVVATTRPETMLGDTAIAINPNDKRYQWLKDAKVILPIVQRQLKVIEDESIDPEFGTGVVKVTPAHDPADFLMGKKHNLDFINIMNDDATLNVNVPDDFINMDRFEARQALIELLEEKKLIDKKEPYKISAGHCYRCHMITEPRLSLQWFVKMKPLAAPAIKVVEEDKIKFSPPRWKKVYLNWMNDIQDWCISRQIWWGHRLPVYYCKSCQEKNPDDDSKGIIVSRTKPEKCPNCASSALIQDSDVLDTWFSSWLWPFATFGWPFKEQATTDKRKKIEELDYFYPTDALVTASEILFFWVARMIMAGLEFKGQIPFNDVIIHGTVRDAQGIKMSKSLGNIIDPLQIIDKFGADALRFSLMMLAASGSDVYLSDEKFLVGRNFCNKIWNATRFILLKVKENNISLANLDPKFTDAVDQWIIKELNSAIEKTTDHLTNYRINEAAKTTYEFFWHDFCDWYLEIIKDSFNEDKAKLAISVLINSIKLLHPTIPFITEEIFQALKQQIAVTLEPAIMSAYWPTQSKKELNTHEIIEIEKLLQTIKEIRNIKADLGLSAKKIKIEVSSKKHSELWGKNNDWIIRLASLDSIVIKTSLTRTLYKNELWALNFLIEGIDMSAFLSTLDKKITKLDSVLATVKGRLKNEKFLSNAPKTTVDEEKEKFNQLNAQRSRLNELKNAFK